MKNILFIANSDTNWLGGVYYVRNIVYQFLMYPSTANTFRVFIYLDKEVEQVFDFCKKYKNVKFVYRKRSLIEKKDTVLSRKYTSMKLISVVCKEKIDYIYPYFSHNAILKDKSVSWIADFQHYGLKHLFTQEEYDERTEYFFDIACNHYKLILSSQDAYETYKKLFPNNLQDVYIVPFISALDEKDITEECSEEVLQKYSISNSNYFLVANQFWQHKNHKIVIEALSILKGKGYDNIVVVCTGLTKDYRNQHYFDDLMSEIHADNIENNIKILGMIPREEQLQLMKGALAVVQPSLFEGWGTVVEDAKTLQKRIVLSDIDVHKEQANADCVFFGRNNARQLADILLKIWQEKKAYVSKVNYNYKEQAAEYGKLFYEALIS